VTHQATHIPIVALSRLLERRAMTDSKRYKVFYCFYGTGKDVPADEPIEMDQADICTELLGALDQEDDFFGLIDVDGTTLQVIYETSKDRYWVEIPRPQQGGSYGRHLSFEGIAALFEALPAKLSLEAFPEFEFQSWS
jgi:hypothetical protein